MPIYSYRCETCGHQQDILQRMSDPLLVTCPSCGASTFRKQVTAAGFQLKGSGWYVTDFRNPATKDPKAAPARPDGEPSGAPPSGEPTAAPAPAPATPAPAPAAESKSAPPPAKSSPAGSD